MAKGFGYKYTDGRVHFTIKYGPIIAGIVVNGEWRRIIFRHTEAADSAIKSLEKANMYERWLGHMNKLEEVPDEYFVEMYDTHLARWIRGYIPSDQKYYDPNFVKVKIKSKVDEAVNLVAKSIDDRYLNYISSGAAAGRSSTIYATEAYTTPPLSQPRPAYTLAEYEAQLRQYERRTARQSPYVPQPWIRGDWAEAPIPTMEIGIAQAGDVAYPTDRAIENMRGTEQERARAEQNRRLMRELDALSHYRTSRNPNNF